CAEANLNPKPHPKPPFWKKVVQNAPKALKHLLVDLMRIIVNCLGSTIDKRQRASNALDGLRQLWNIINKLQEDLEVLNMTSDAQGSEDGSIEHVLQDQHFGQMGWVILSWQKEQQLIGIQQRNEILAALYLIRPMIWKSVVQNTPKALKHLLVNLMRVIIDCLGSTNLDKYLVRLWTISYRSHVQSHLPHTHHHVQPQGTYVIAQLSGLALNQHLAAVQPSSVPLQHQVTRPIPSPRRVRRPNSYQVLCYELIQQMRGPISTSHTAAAKLIGSYCERTEVEFEPELSTLMSHLMDDSSLAQQLALTSLKRDFEKATRKDNVAKYIPELKMQLHQGHSGPNKGPTNSKPPRSKEEKGTEVEKRGKKKRRGKERMHMGSDVNQWSTGNDTHLARYNQ
ncbi:hypothetical protein PROFUN_12448, partial [Planoprotostelium fungivorum]